MSSIHCLDYIIDMAGYVLKKYRIKRSIIKSGGGNRDYGKTFRRR